MTPAALVEYLLRRGFSLRMNGEKIAVRPRPSDRLAARILARKPEIIAYLRERSSATRHAFTTLALADLRKIQRYGVCIACGVPWSMHGEPPLRDWRFVDDPNDVALVDASGMLAALCAEAIVAPLQLGIGEAP